MLRRLKKIAAGPPAIYRWNIQVRMPEGSFKARVNTNIEADEAEAHAIYGELLAAKSRHKLGLPVKHGNIARIKLGDACAQYEQHLRTVGRVDRYITDVIRELQYLRNQLGDNFPVQAIAREHMLEWQKKRKAMPRHGKMPSSRNVNKCLAMLSGFFTYCKTDRGWLTVQPADITRLPEKAPPPKILDWAQYIRFVHAAWSERPLVAIFLEVLGESGARVSEVVNVKVSDIDTKRGVWRRKVKGGRTVDVDAMEWAVWLAKGREADEPLCPTESGEPWTYRMIEKAFKRYRRVTDQKSLMPHHFRHARACWLLAEGINAHRVKNFLCHTNISTTEGYLAAAEQIRRSEPPGTIHKHLCHLCDKEHSKDVVKRHKGWSPVTALMPFKVPTDKDLRCKS